MNCNERTDSLQYCVVAGSKIWLHPHDSQVKWAWREPQPRPPDVAMAETLSDSVYDFSQLSDLPPDLCWTNPPPETSLGTEGLKVIAAHSGTLSLAWYEGS